MNEDAAIRFLVLIAESRTSNSPSETDLARIAAPYYAFKDSGAEVVMATLSGGPPQGVEGMRTPAQGDAAVRRFRADRDARDDLADTVAMDAVAVEDFVAAYCVGLSGQLWAQDDHGIASVVQTFLRAAKPVALVPGRHLQIAPEGAGQGLLILGDSACSPLCAARALIDIVADLRRLGRAFSPIYDA
ncbi:transporter [Paracoccus aestuariivivens]|uniref:Transporter n=1 Tax=Paracoccus aestuariivivens TaxID=1820333 RepID=A0A6L6J8G9_9RHOB|nr:transporter [Paracoccus aestuariivivens]MTH78372.1 transporter [Paracoccus aestuariivivens]